jgi:hypothetical protein
MNDLEVTLEQNTDFQTTVYDINYLPDYVKAEEERRANETIRISNEQNRQANELLRVALYNDLEEKKEQDYWRGNGIVSTTKTGTSGLVDTYTITYDDGETDTFTVTNGQDGQDGRDGDPGQDGQDGQDATINGVNTLTIQEGQNITITQSGSTMTISSTGGSGTSDYDDLTNKPSINSITLSGNKSLSDLGIQPSGNYVTNTDYAGGSTGGVIKVGNQVSLTNGVITANKVSYSTYSSAGDNMFIGKGTLENVITGKSLVDSSNVQSNYAHTIILSQNTTTGDLTVGIANYNGTTLDYGTIEGVATRDYVDSLVGDINTALDTINGEVV